MAGKSLPPPTWREAAINGNDDGAAETGWLRWWWCEWGWWLGPRNWLVDEPPTPAIVPPQVVAAERCAYG